MRRLLRRGALRVALLPLLFLLLLVIRMALHYQQQLQHTIYRVKLLRQRVQVKVEGARPLAPPDSHSRAPEWLRVTPCSSTWSTSRPACCVLVSAFAAPPL